MKQPTQDLKEVPHAWLDILPLVYTGDKGTLEQPGGWSTA